MGETKIMPKILQQYFDEVFDDYDPYYPLFQNLNNLIGDLAILKIKLS